MARQRRSTSNRRRLVWVGNELTSVGENNLLPATTKIYQQLDMRIDANHFLVGGTIARTRGTLKIWSDQVAAVEEPFGASGMALVNGEAFDAGAASCPAPYTESSSERWLSHNYFSAPTQFISGSISPDYERIDIDSKGMRKIKTDDVLVWMIENKNSGNACNFFWLTRILIMLP